VTVSADADAWIEQNSPSQNKGTDSVLKVRSKNSSSNARALVRFALPAIPSGCEVDAATLRLFGESAVNGRTLRAVGLTGTWTENGVTWANQPAAGGATATATSGTGWRTWTVTEHVAAMYAGTNHGFLIRDANENQGSSPEQSLSSREKGTNTPQLVITFRAAGTAGGAIVTSGSGPLPTAAAIPARPSPVTTPIWLLGLLAVLLVVGAGVRRPGPSRPTRSPEPLLAHP
jgi:hypothetical protein